MSGYSLLVITGVEHMCPFHVGNIYTLWCTQHHRTHVHRKHARDIAKGAVEFLCAISLISLPLLTKTDTRRWADRLENEHLGNMDQYRVTREVPLPYHLDTHSNGDEDEEEHEEETPASANSPSPSRSQSWLKRRMTMTRLTRGHKGHG